MDEFQHRTESRQWKLSCGVSGLWVSASRPLASEDILELEDREWEGGGVALIAAHSLFQLEPSPS